MAATTPAKGRLLAGALALVIFAAGIAAGIAVDRLWIAPKRSASDQDGRHESVEHIVDDFRTRLGLDDDQARRVGDIVRRVRGRAADIHEETEEAYRQAHERAQAEILEVLTPEQTNGYHELIEKYHRRHRTHRRDHGPGHRPPAPDHHRLHH